MSQIFLDEALGITDSTPPIIIAERWEYWKNNNPNEYDRLYSSIVAQPQIIGLNTISTAVAAYNLVVETAAQAKQLYESAIITYNAAMAILTGGASTALIAAETAYKQVITGDSKGSIKYEATQLYTNAKTAVKEVITNATNLKVNSDTALPDILP